MRFLKASRQDYRLLGEIPICFIWPLATAMRTARRLLAESPRLWRIRL